jgi:drug/metabolite transporter (DMT)-like permease
VAFPYTRRFLSGRPEGGVAMAATQLAWASVQLSVVALVVGDTPQAPKLNAVLSMVALGALGSGLAYVLNFRIVRLAGATTAATIGYLIPLFSTVLGVIVLGESLSWNQPIGAVVVLAGVYLASRAGAPRRELVTAS